MTWYQAFRNWLMDARNRPRELRRDNTLCRRAMDEIGVKEMGFATCEACIVSGKTGLHDYMTCQHWANAIYQEDPANVDLAQHVLAFLKGREDWRLGGSGLALKKLVYAAAPEQMELDHA